MKGFKSSGNGPKKGFRFPSKVGFSASTGKTRQVRGYSQSIPKKDFATGGVVQSSDEGSALTRRIRPVTQFDKVAGGKSPLRPGFNRGGMAKMVDKAAAAAAQGYKQGRVTADAKPQVGMAPRGGVPGGPIKRAVGAVQQGFTPAPQGQKLPVATGRVANHGYGSFGRRPVVG